MFTSKFIEYRNLQKNHTSLLLFGNCISPHSFFLGGFQSTQPPHFLCLMLTPPPKLLGHPPLV